MIYALSVLGWLAASLLFMSILEYVLHRWPMHNRRFVGRFPFLRDVFYRHTILHHSRFYKDHFDHCDDPAGPHVNIMLEPGVNLLGIAPLWLPIALFVSLTGGVVLALVVVVHAVVWTAIHREMHDPRRRWFSRTRAYRYLSAYHEVHHQHPGSNFNIVLPGMDWLFGTYRRPEVS